jgi:hypothetical protein
MSFQGYRRLVIKCLLQAFRDIRFGMRKGDEWYQTEEEIVEWLKSPWVRGMAEMAGVDLPANEEMEACAERARLGTQLRWHVWEREGIDGEEDRVILRDGEPGCRCV